MNVRRRALRKLRLKQDASIEDVEKKFEHVQHGMDELLDRLESSAESSLHLLDEALRKVTGRTVWDFVEDRERNQSIDFAGATFSLHWYLKKGRFDTMSYADFKKNVQGMVKDTCKEARKEHWLFQGIVVIADWHHRGHRQADGHHRGNNNKDYHVHILTFGKPKAEVLKYMAEWWGKHLLGQYVKHGTHVGTIEYKWSVDYGWYVYLLDNLHGSTKGIGKAITMSTNKYNHHKPGWIESNALFNRTWAVNDWHWSAFMRPMGSYDRAQADGLVDREDQFDEFGIDG